jgi:hypothetical protein
MLEMEEDIKLNLMKINKKTSISKTGNAQLRTVKKKKRTEEANCS